MLASMHKCHMYLQKSKEVHWCCSSLLVFKCEKDLLGSSADLSWAYSYTCSLAEVSFALCCRFDGVGLPHCHFSLGSVN